MTVKELIEKLQEYPDHLKVYISRSNGEGVDAPLKDHHITPGVYEKKYETVDSSHYNVSQHNSLLISDIL